MKLHPGRVLPEPPSGGSMAPYLVGVPQTDGAAQRQLPHQQVVHPPEGKLQVLHLTPEQVAVNVLWRSDNTQGS